MPLEKAILAIIHATKKLPHYFQAHMVFILTKLPLQALLQKSDYTRRVAKWGTMLGSFDIRYLPRTAIKGKGLADLVVLFTEGWKRMAPRREVCLTKRCWLLQHHVCYFGKYMWMGY